MKRSIPYMIGILIIAIILQVVWNQMKSDGNNKQTSKTEQNEHKSMEDLLLDDKDESEIDLHEAIEQMKEQPEKVAIPNKSHPMYNTYIHYQKEEENVALKYSYPVKELDEALVFLTIETINDLQREYAEEQIEDAEPFEYKGYEGIIGYESTFDDTVVILSEKDGYSYEYRVFRPIEKEDWKSFYEAEIDRLAEEDNRPSVNQHLQLADEKLDKIIYPYFTADVRKLIVSLDYTYPTGPSLEVLYFLSEEDSMQYTIYFEEEAEELIDEAKFVTEETPGGMEVQVLDRGKNNPLARYYYYWKMDGMTFEISHSKNEEMLNEDEIFTLIDSLEAQR